MQFDILIQIFILAKTIVNQEATMSNFSLFNHIQNTKNLNLMCNQMSNAYKLPSE